MKLSLWLQYMKADIKSPRYGWTSEIKRLSLYKRQYYILHAKTNKDKTCSPDNTNKYFSEIANRLNLAPNVSEAGLKIKV